MPAKPSTALQIALGCSGFLLFFAFFFASFTLYAVNRGSLWLPAAAGLCYFGISSLWPNIQRTATRGGLSCLFVGGACWFWIASDRPLPTLAQKIDARQLIHSWSVYSFLLLAAMGFLIILGSAFRRGSKARVGAPLLLIVLGWLVSFFSSTHGAADPMLEWAMQTFHLDRASAELFVVILRKTIHFTFYALVGAAGYLASSSNGGSKSTSLQSGLLSALAFASYDEFRQHSMPNREGSILDVGLDMLGAITALAIINGVSRSNRLAHKS